MVDAPTGLHLRIRQVQEFSLHVEADALWWTLRQDCIFASGKFRKAWLA